MIEFNVANTFKTFWLTTPDFVQWVWNMLELNATMFYISAHGIYQIL